MGTISVTLSSYYARAILPDELAIPAFVSLGEIVATTYHDRATWYRTAFFSVGLEALEPTGLQALLHRVLRWFRQGDAHGDLAGHITDSNTNTGVAHVDVAAAGIWDGYAVASNASGHYTFSLLAGDYDLVFDKPGYFTVSLPNLTVFTDTITSPPTVLGESGGWY